MRSIFSNERGDVSVEQAIGTAIAVIVVIAILGAIASSIVSIEAGNVGVVFDKQNGVIDPVPLDQGWRFVKPYGVTVIPYDSKIQVEKATASAGTKDLQTVTTEVAVNFRIDPADAPWIHQNIGPSYKTIAIDNQIQEAVKAATAKFTADQLLPQREEVKQMIQTLLKESLVANRIHVTGISITDFKFSPEYQKAIEDKQVSSQKALQAEYDLKKIKVEAEQRIAQAEGEAKAIAIQVEAITKQGGSNYIALQWIKAWNGVPPQYYMVGGSQNPGMLFTVPAAPAATSEAK